MNSTKWLAEGGRLDTSRGSRFMRGDRDIVSQPEASAPADPFTTAVENVAAGRRVEAGPARQDGEAVTASAVEPQPVKAALPDADVRRNAS